MKFVDMFCGMGTIRMGFEQAGHECVYSVEFDKHKREIYKVIFGSEPDAGDITTVRANDIPRSDCWCFGAPCQDFSVAGLRAGLDGERSGLVREVFRLVREKEPADRPEWLLYENVKGMLSSNNGWDFAAIQAEMGQCGYDVQWQLLNSKDFGVPQNRERVYTLGHLRAKGRRKVFPIGESNGIPETSRIKRTLASEHTASAITKNYSKGVHSGGETYVKTLNTKDANGKEPAQQNRVYSTDGIMTALSAQLSGRFNIAEPLVKQIGNVMPTATRDNPNQGRVYDPAGLAPCLNKMEGGGREPLVIYDLYHKKVKPGTAIGTLTSNSCSSTTHCGTFGVKCNTRIRRLTPRECMRLQGVDDAVTDKLIAAGISDTQMYRAAGDACTVNVIYEIARRLA